MQQNNEQNGLQQTNPQLSWWEMNKPIIKTYVSNGLISFCAFVVIWVVFIVQYALTRVNNTPGFGFTRIDFEVLLKMGGNVAIMVRLGQFYRLITAIFLHAGSVHIAMNSITLIAFCALLQAKTPRIAFLLTFLLGGVQGNLLSDFYSIHFGDPLLISVGMSTSICAIMGLYLVHVYIDGRNTGRVSLAKKEIIITLIYLLLISLMPSVDFFGHLGGLISGAMIGTCIIALFETPRVKLHLLGSFGLTLLYSGLLFTFYA